jgi:hypothetical protein
MCTGDGCPLKDTCYRFKATPSEYMQAFFTKPPWTANEQMLPGVKVGCNYYWPVESKSQLKRLDAQNGD